MGVNINGVKNCVRAELQNFSTKGGSIVNAASVAGQEGVPFNSAYGASKAGVISLCKSVAKEVAPRNIRVNGESDLDSAQKLPLIQSQQSAPALLTPIS